MKKIMTRLFIVLTVGVCLHAQIEPPPPHTYESPLNDLCWTNTYESQYMNWGNDLFDVGDFPNFDEMDGLCHGNLDALRALYYNGPQNKAFLEYARDEYNPDHLDYNQEDMYHAGTRTTTLGMLAWGANVIGVGRVVNIDGNYLHVTVDLALAGCTNGAIVKILTHPNPKSRDSFPFLPSENDRIVFTDYFSGKAWPMRWDNSVDPFWMNANFLFLEPASRNWWFADQDDGELFTQFTNILQAVRFDRDKTNYYNLCRQGAASPSDRVREDAYWDMAGIIWDATHEQEHMINDDPLVSPQNKAWLFKRDWFDFKTRERKGLPAFRNKKYFNSNNMAQYMDTSNLTTGISLYRLKNSTLGELAKYADVIGVGRASEQSDTGFKITVEHPMVGCTNNESILVCYPVVRNTRRKPNDFDFCMPTNNSRIVFIVDENQNNTNENKTFEFYCASRSWWYVDHENGALTEQFANILQSVRVEPNWTNYCHFCLDGATSTSHRVREDSYLDMWKIIDSASLEEKHLLYDETSLNQNFKDYLHDYFLEFDYDSMDFWPSCGKSHEIKSFSSFHKPARGIFTGMRLICVVVACLTLAAVGLFVKWK